MGIRAFVIALFAQTGVKHRPEHPYGLGGERKASAQSSDDRYMMLMSKNLVTVEDCLNAVEEQGKNDCNDIVFIDGSWYHKGGRVGRKEYEDGPRIKGAKYIDMMDIATTKELYPEKNPKGLPAMLPQKELFAATMDRFRIRNDDHVIIYGREGCLFTPRTWFLFQEMGHDLEKVHLLQASLEEWIAAGGDVDNDIVTVPSARDILADHEPTSYVATDPVRVVDLVQVLESVKQDDIILIDPRGSSFAKGHIPGSINIPYSSLVEKDNPLKLKSKENLLHVFKEAGVDPLTDKTIISTCGSGVSVCHVMLALEECGRSRDKPTFMYDGSWSEWGKDPRTPKTRFGDN